MNETKSLLELLTLCALARSWTTENEDHNDLLVVEVGHPAISGWTLDVEIVMVVETRRNMLAGSSPYITTDRILSREGDFEADTTQKTTENRPPDLQRHAVLEAWDTSSWEYNR